MIGQRLLHYEVVGKLGEGGMGVVYKARDTHLDRFVAIKILPPDKVADAERERRFVQEAKAASALNHPNIITVHDTGEADGSVFIVMEYVPGKTLTDLISRKRIGLKETLRYGVQMADALTSAHEAGIIHRDVKPGNVMVTDKGLVKVLDFGLAKLTEAAAIGEDSATRTLRPMTEVGTVVGTVAYMAPEQAEGKAVDARSDIFSFGAVLYEMVTGRRAFLRDSKASTLAAVLTAEPGTLPPEVPYDLQKIIVRCLRKDPAHRFQHMDDLKVALEEVKEESDSGRLAGVQAPARPFSRRFLWPALVATAVVVLGAAGVFGWRRMHAAPLTDQDVLVLADFTNTTGDNVFDDTLKQGLAVQLEQSPFLNLVSDRRVNETLKLMGRPAGDRLTPEVTREVCQRTNSKAMLAGSIAALGNQYVIGLRAVNCATGDVLAVAQEQASGKEAVLEALDATAVRLRSKLGESLSTVQKYATPVQEATTSSLEALKAYSLGQKTALAKGFTAGRPFFQRAMDLDPNFALAYASMGATYFDLSEGGRGAEFIRKAYDLREKVSERERFMIEAVYYYYLTRELEKAAQTCELFQQIYPRDGLAYTCAGIASWALGNWGKALEELREAQRLDPNNANSYSTVGFAYTVFNRLDEAEAVFKQAEERKLESEALLLVRYFVAFLKGDVAQMAQLVSAAMGKPGAEDLMLATQAGTEGWCGKLKNAHELTRRAMDSAQHRDAKEAAAAYQAAAALREVESGNRERARAEAHAALNLGPNREVRVMAALALARAGDTAGAEKLAVELDKAFPLDTLVQRYWLPTIRAGVALERRDAKRAIDLLKTVRMIELSGLTGDLAIFMSPVFVRGEAYLMLHDGNAAVAEFQKFIDHRGLVVNSPWGALGWLGLARAYALQGNTAKARAAYEGLLTLWKDADPDLPVLTQAQQEYAKLK
jgi:eukaryotic-like serine/threonine-protein kinase